MQQPSPPRPKLAEIFIEPTVKLREAVIGRCCEILGDTAIEYSELGDYSYLGPGCIVRDAEIGRFCAIAAQLSQIAWWNWPAETIWQRLGEFQSGNVDAFCARWGKS